MDKRAPLSPAKLGARIGVGRMALAIGTDGPDTALAGRTGSVLYRAGDGVIDTPWPAGCGADATISGPDAPDLHTSIACYDVDRSGAPRALLTS